MQGADRTEPLAVPVRGRGGERGILTRLDNELLLQSSAAANRWSMDDIQLVALGTSHIHFSVDGNLVELAVLRGDPAPLVASIDRAPSNNDAPAGDMDGETRHRPNPAVPWLMREWAEPIELVEGTLVLIGRDPEPTRGDQAAILDRVPADFEEVSKTHVAIHVADGRVLVEDRHSRNGCVLVPPSGAPRAVRPGTPTLVEVGSELAMGDRILRIQ